MINNFTFLGNVGRDPEIKRLENGTPVARFTMATNESYKDQTSNEWITLTEWHDVIAWRGLAEAVERIVKKGSLVYVEGKVTHRKYTDKNGVEKYATEFVANTVRCLDKKEKSDNFPTEEPPNTKEKKGFDSSDNFEQPEPQSEFDVKKLVLNSEYDIKSGTGVGNRFKIISLDYQNGTAKISMMGSEYDLTKEKLSDIMSRSVEFSDMPF